MILIYTTGYFFEKNRDIKIINKKIDKRTVEIATVKKLKDNETVIAYTSLKTYNGIIEYKTVDLLRVEGCYFKVFEKKKKLRRIVGYVPIGDNRFIGVQKLNLLPIILFPLLLCLILSFAFCGRNSNAPTNEPVSPIEDVSNETTTENKYNPEYEVPLNDNVTESTFENKEIDIKLKACYIMVVSKETGMATVVFSNDKNNPCDLYFSVYLSDGTLLYKSKAVAPGNELTKIQLNTVLDEGTYKGYYKIDTAALETGAAMNNASFSLDIIVR